MPKLANAISTIGGEVFKTNLNAAYKITNLACNALRLFSASHIHSAEDWIFNCIEFYILRLAVSVSVTAASVIAVTAPLKPAATTIAISISIAKLTVAATEFSIPITTAEFAITATGWTIPVPITAAWTIAIAKLTTATFIAVAEFSVSTRTRTAIIAVVPALEAFLRLLLARLCCICSRF